MLLHQPFFCSEPYKWFVFLDGSGFNYAQMAHFPWRVYPFFLVLFTDAVTNEGILP